MAPLTRIPAIPRPIKRSGMLDADILWSFATFWIIGGLLGGLVTLEAGMFAQKKFIFQ